MGWIGSTADKMEWIFGVGTTTGAKFQCFILFRSLAITSDPEGKLVMYEFEVLATM
jgi:hypothetical protein